MKFNESIKESLTLKFAQAVRERRSEGGSIVSLGLGEPDFEVPEQLTNGVIEALKGGHHGYSSALGNTELRKLISKSLDDLDNIKSPHDQIMIVPGAKQAIQLTLMALLEPSDEVVLLDPSFVSFQPQIYFAEPSAVIRRVDLRKSDFSLSHDALKDVVSSRTKVLIINSPNNPAGTLLSPEDIRFIYDLAVEYDFYVISDEVYKRLEYDTGSTLSIASLEIEPSRVFTVNGFSKSHGLTGWRVGFVCFPLKFRQKLILLQQHINTNTCTFVQQGLATSLSMNMGFLESYKLTLQKRLNRLQDAFVKTRIQMVRPKAGFFVFMNISGYGVDSNTFCSELMRIKGVALTPGVAFGPNWDDHVRLSIAVNEEELLRGITLILEFLITLDDKCIVNS